MEESMGLHVMCDKNIAWTQCGKIVDIWCEMMDDNVSDIVVYRFRELFWGLLFVEFNKKQKVTLLNIEEGNYHGIWTPLCFTGVSPKDFSKGYHGRSLKRIVLYPSGVIKIDYKDHSSEWLGVEDYIADPKAIDMEMAWDRCRVVRNLWLGVIDKTRTSEEQIDHFRELFLSILLFEYSKGKTVQTYRPENYKGIWTPLWFAGIPPKFFCGEYNGDHLRRVTLYPDGKIKVAYVGENKTEDWL